MLRSVLGLVATICFASSLFAQTYNIRHDDALKTPVTLSVRYGPIREVLKALSKQTGVSVSAATAISDLKVSVFVKEVPCQVVLDRIGAVLDCHWRNDSGNRILITTTSDSRDLQKYLDEEDLILRKRAEGQLARIMGRPVDPETIDQAVPGSSPFPRFHRGMPGPNNAAMMQQFSRIFSDASSSDMDSFWSGSVLHFQMEDRNGQFSRGMPFRPGVPRRNTESGVTEVYARYDYLGTHDIQFGSSKLPVSTQRFVIPGLTTPVSTLATTAYGKRLLAWPDLSVDESETAYNQPLPPSPDHRVGFQAKALRGESEEQIFQERTQTELLEKFSKDSGIPIVSDGFRIALSPEVEDPQGATPLTWLKSFAANFGAEIQIRDGVATVRQGGFWRLRQYEIPEDLLRPMEKTGPESLSISDYANFCYQLTPAQAKSFLAENAPRVSFPTDSIIASIPALRLIGSLSSSFPVNGHPVPAEELSEETQDLINQAITESVFTGDAWEIRPGAEQRTPLYLLLEQANVSLAEGTVPGVNLQIGLPIGQIVNFSIPLRLTPEE